MPFGLKGAPVAYLDDIVIYSQTWEDHLAHIADVFDRLAAA